MFKKLIIFFLPLIFMVISCHQIETKSVSYMKSNFTPLSYEQADQKADSVWKLMTLDEKIAFVGGDRDFFIRPLSRLNLPEVYMVDATQGVHIRDKFRDVDLSEYSLEKSTAFPCQFYWPLPGIPNYHTVMLKLLAKNAVRRYWHPVGSRG